MSSTAGKERLWWLGLGLGLGLGLVEVSSGHSCEKPFSNGCSIGISSFAYEDEDCIFRRTLRADRQEKGDG